MRELQNWNTKLSCVRRSTEDNLMFLVANLNKNIEFRLLEGREGNRRLLFGTSSVMWK